MTELTEAAGWIQDPGVQLMPIARSLTPMKPRMIYFHTNGNGIGTSTPAGMFSSIQRQIAAGSTSVIIPTFEVGMSATAQFKSIFVAPSTQLNANPFSVGIETADSGAQNNPFGGIDHEPWNPYQVDMLIKIAAFCARVAGVSLDRADMWNGHGCEGHCASNLIPGDQRGFTHPNVTTATGKICPGHARLAQIPTILAGAKALLVPPPVVVPPPVDPVPPAPPVVDPPVPPAPPVVLHRPKKGSSDMILNVTCPQRPAELLLVDGIIIGVPDGLSRDAFMAAGNGKHVVVTAAMYDALVADDHGISNI